MAEKSQPWKTAWPPAEPKSEFNSADNSDSQVDYGVAQGGVVVVDGTAANVKPAAPLKLEQTEKTQPWKASWLATADATTVSDEVEYGVAKGDTVVVDGTAANVKPSSANPKVTA